MRYFFVDTENIQKYNFIDDMELQNNDTVIMMHSSNSKNISIIDLKRFIKSGANIEFEEAFTGTKNALDFQLVTNLALTINQELQDNSYYIVSNDNGFEVVINYLKNKVDAEIEQIRTQEPVTNIEVAASEETTETTDTKVNDELGLIMKQCPDLSRLHNKLREIYGNEEGRKIYLKVKNDFKK